LTVALDIVSFVLLLIVLFLYCSLFMLRLALAEWWLSAMALPWYVGIVIIIIVLIGMRTGSASAGVEPWRWWWLRILDLRISAARPRDIFCKFIAFHNQIGLAVWRNVFRTLIEL
jgi:hypothetical protein